MKDTLILEGKSFISARRAALLINYSQDYVGQLCRAGKLECKMVGRSWFVTEESLLAHRESTIDGGTDRTSAPSPSTPSAPVASVSAPSLPAASAAPAVPSARAAEAPKPEIPALKYESEVLSPLPAIVKKVPSSFSLPQKKMEFTPAPRTAHAPAPASASVLAPSSSRPFPAHASYASSTSSVAIPHSRSLSAVLAVVLLAASGIAFSFSFSLFTDNGKNFIAMLQDLMPTTSTDTAPSVATQSAGTDGSNLLTANLNGIGVVPSSNLAGADEAAKAKIRNNFSDEVVIEPDKSGTAGVIKPVFKDKSGDDFVYVLVPVKDQDKP